MARHWTYTDLDPNSDLRQGDVLEPTAELRRLFEQVHRHFTDPKYLSFIVVTQTCDLVRRAGTCSARHVNLAVVRSLQGVLFELLDHECEKLAPGFYAEKSRDRANMLLSRICNQNEAGLFYLYPDGEIGIGEDAVAQLRVSVAFRADHYEILRQARRGCLTPEFAARLGWLMGNLYSRVAVPDWSENESRREELRRKIKTYLSPSGARDGPCWIRQAVVAQLAKEVLPQNLWVETWGNRRRRFPQTPSWGFFPLTGLRRPARAKPALRMRAASRNPTKLGFALFPAAERLTGDADPRKVTHEFC